MLDVFARNCEHIHVRFDGTQAHETLSEKLSRAKLQLLRAKSSHALQDMLPLPHMSPFVRPNEIGDVKQESVLTFASGVDEMIDGLQDADFAEEIDLSHGERRFHRTAAT